MQNPGGLRKTARTTPTSYGYSGRLKSTTPPVLAITACATKSFTSAPGPLVGGQLQHGSREHAVLPRRSGSFRGMDVAGMRPLGDRLWAPEWEGSQRQAEVSAFDRRLGKTYLAKLRQLLSEVRQVFLKVPFNKDINVRWLHRQIHKHYALVRQAVSNVRIGLCWSMGMNLFRRRYKDVWLYRVG